MNAYFSIWTLWIGEFFHSIGQLGNQQNEPFLNTNTSNLLSNTFFLLFISIVQKYLFQGFKHHFHLVSDFSVSISLQKKKWEGNKIKQNAIRFSTFFCLCDSTWPFQYYFQLLTSSVAFIFIRSISVLIIFLWIVSSSSDYFSRAHLSRCSRKSPVWFFCWLY